MLGPAVNQKQLALGLLFMLLPVLPAVAAPSTLPAINTNQFYTLQLGMQVLGSWALGNIIYSSFLLPKASRSRRYFYQLNLLWNLVNLLIAIGGFYFAITADPEMPLANSIRLHYCIRNILLFSIGLAIAFIMLGQMLQKNARMVRKPERNWGNGRSVILQALFLLLFGIGFYLTFMHFGPQLTDLIK